MIEGAYLCTQLIEEGKATKSYEGYKRSGIFSKSLILAQDERWRRA